MDRERRACLRAGFPPSCFSWSEPHIDLDLLLDENGTVSALLLLIAKGGSCLQNDVAECAKEGLDD